MRLAPRRRIERDWNVEKVSVEIKRTPLSVMMAERLRIMSIVNENEGEIPAELEQQFLVCETDIPEKVEQWAFVMKGFEHEAEFLKAEAKKLSDRARKYEQHYDYMKLRMKMIMSESDIKVLNGTMTKFSLRPTRPSLKIFDQESIPNEFLDEKMEIVPNRDRIMEALKGGKEIPGVRLEGGAALYTGLVNARAPEDKKQKAPTKLEKAAEAIDASIAATEASNAE